MTPRQHAVIQMPRGTLRTVHGPDAGYTGKRKATAWRSVGRCSNGHGSKRARLIGGKCRLCREAGL